jgi:hypothetical protein
MHGVTLRCCSLSFPTVFLSQFLVHSSLQLPRKPGNFCLPKKATSSVPLWPATRPPSGPALPHFHAAPLPLPPPHHSQHPSPHQPARMADTCIVCLGDLGTDDSAVAAAPAELTATATATIAAITSPSAPSPDELIAHLLPCGHNLHDSCLKPWVERANSCPICRAKFNSVELKATVNGAYRRILAPKFLTFLGPTISSYPVQDKVQVAEIDPSLIVDDDVDDLDQDDHFDTCMVCMITGDESQLLLCDGCNNSCHVCCAGLDSIPAGTWFCYDCLQDPQTIARRNRRRRNARRPRRPNQDSRTTWAYLWRSVANRTNIDLDFPFPDEPVTDNTPEQRREFNTWQRRFQVAARAAGPGAANRFREIARAPEPPKPEPESQEEIRAWNAFEKARIIDEEDGQTRGRRKRKSRTTSPESADPPPLERKRKRPRTLLIQDRAQDAELTDSTLGESSRARSSRVRRDSAAAPRPRPSRIEPTVAPPTFLQSLLAEVEAKSAQAAPGLELEYDVHGEYFPFGLERSTSPDASPLASNHGTPRAMTPPPLRPSSPTLTTNISPIFPPAPEFSQDSVAVQDSVERARSRQRDHVKRQSPGSSPTRPALAMSEPVVQPSSPPPQAPQQPQSPPPLSLPIASSPPSVAKSPKSGALNLRAKTEIQALVKAALKPHYRGKRIGATAYTQINRDVSRRMYELVGGGEMGVADKERWTRVAEEEVAMAIAGLPKHEENDDGEQLVVALGLAKDVAKAGAELEEAEANACLQTA